MWRQSDSSSPTHDGGASAGATNPILAVSCSGGVPHMTTGTLYMGGPTRPQTQTMGSRDSSCGLIYASREVAQPTTKAQREDE